MHGKGVDEERSPRSFEGLHARFTASRHDLEEEMREMVISNVSRPRCWPVLKQDRRDHMYSFGTESSGFSWVFLCRGNGLQCIE